MVSQHNVGSLDQLARMILAIFLVFLFFMDPLPASYNIVLLAVSGLFMYTAVLQSCEAYTWLGTKTSETTRRIPLEEAVEKLVGVVAIYLVLALFRYYLL